MATSPTPRLGSGHNYSFLSSLDALPGGAFALPLSYDTEVPEALARAYRIHCTSKERATFCLWGMAAIAGGGFVGQRLGAVNFSAADGADAVLMVDRPDLCGAASEDIRCEAAGAAVSFRPYGFSAIIADPMDTSTLGPCPRIPGGGPNWLAL